MTGGRAAGRKGASAAGGGGGGLCGPHRAGSTPRQGDGALGILTSPPKSYGESSTSPGDMAAAGPSWRRGYGNSYPGGHMRVTRDSDHSLCGHTGEDTLRWQPKGPQTLARYHFWGLGKGALRRGIAGVSLRVTPFSSGADGWVLSKSSAGRTRGRREHVCPTPCGRPAPLVLPGPASWQGPARTPPRTPAGEQAARAPSRPQSLPLRHPSGLQHRVTVSHSHAGNLTPPGPCAPRSAPANLGSRGPGCSLPAR